MIDISTLSETQLNDKDYLTEIGSAYTFFWKDKLQGERCDGAIGLAIKSELVNLLEHSQVFSNRIMQLKVPLPDNNYMTFISVYAPILIVRK